MDNKKLYGMHTYNPIDRPDIYCVAWSYYFNSGAIIGEEIRKWCRETFGDSVPKAISHSEWIDSEYLWRDYVVWGEIEFKSEKHLNWFLLKWQ